MHVIEGGSGPPDSGTGFTRYLACHFWQSLDRKAAHNGLGKRQLAIEREFTTVVKIRFEFQTESTRATTTTGPGWPRRAAGAPA